MDHMIYVVFCVVCSSSILCVMKWIFLKYFLVLILMGCDVVFWWGLWIWGQCLPHSSCFRCRFEVNRRHGKHGWKWQAVVFVDLLEEFLMRYDNFVSHTMRLVPSQDAPLALILWYVPKTIYLSQEQDQFAIKISDLFFDNINTYSL